MPLLGCFRLAVIPLLLFLPPVQADTPSNIVWIVGEDMGPELGCYGDANAITPNMDRLASQGVRFTRCFTHAPVCAPSRSGLITGRYPTSIGTHHMRSTLLKPPPLFTDYLKKSGYTIAWPTRTPYGKTDFNFALPPKAFDITTDWTKEIPKQPFFGFYNILTSHESQIRAPAAVFARNTARLKPSERRDPAKMKLPAYYPDTPEVRRDLANYYELVTAVDYQVGVVLDALEKAGIADNTLVLLTGDHGRGLPRSKRWVYNQGAHVPLIVRWPGRLKPGSVRDDLVCFLDFAPTMLALAAAEVPKEMQGQVILGPKTAPERKYLFAARDRMDETYDRIRGVRDKRFQYIRNFHPELPYAQRIDYMELMPTMRVWRKLNAEGKLNAVQKQFFAATKPPEELYDVDADPDEVHNLAGEAKYQGKLQELRTALDRWMVETKDLGTIPERELIKRGLVADRLAEYEKRKETDPAILRRFLDEFVQLTPGEGKFPASFTMGSTGEVPDAEKPAVIVTLRTPFAIARYEVTQELYQTIVGRNPSKWKGRRNSVEMVSWEEANDFCRKATAELRRRKLLREDEEIRLPSEAEWEYACRAGSKTAYSFGDTSDKLGEYAWFTGNAKGEDPPVGKKKPNAWGLYDMHGYVWEWCADAWHPTHKDAATDGRPRVRKDEPDRVLRGGSWADDADHCRSAFRHHKPLDFRNDAIGFRCVRAAIPKEKSR